MCGIRSPIPIVKAKLVHLFITGFMRFVSLKLKKIDVLMVKATPAHKKDLKNRQKRSNTDLIMGASERALVKNMFWQNIKDFRLKK